MPQSPTTAAGTQQAPSAPAASNDDTIIPVVFIVFIGFPLALAYARRVWKRSTPTIAPASRELQDRIDQLTQAVESIALETERIGEGQRFLTRLLTEQGGAKQAAARLTVPHDAPPPPEYTP